VRRGASSAGPAPPSLSALFVAFLLVGVCGFGGGIVWVDRFVVARRRWLSAQDFTELLSLAQIMPGPNLATLAVCIGARLRGLPGALAALAGFMVIPATAGFVAGALLLAHSGDAIIQGMLTGIAATASGLVIGTGLRLLRQAPKPDAWVMAALAFGLIVFFRLPLPVVLGGVAPVGIALAAYRITRAS
jgi:chromate transporter